MAEEQRRPDLKGVLSRLRAATTSDLPRGIALDYCLVSRRDLGALLDHCQKIVSASATLSEQLKGSGIFHAREPFKTRPKR